MRALWCMALMTAAMLVLMPGGWAQDEVPYSQTENLVYAEVHGTGLLMDVFTPKGEKNGLGIIDIGSGAWHSDRGKINDHKKAGFYDVFCGRGYTVFVIRPGSVSRYTGLEMLDHVNKGILFVKAHAAEYGVDPERLGLCGASAGGHLALLATVNATTGRADAETPAERFGTRVKAVSVFFPPTDFLDWGGRTFDLSRRGELFFLGGTQGRSAEEVQEAAEKLSPARQVKGELPPILLIHGDADTMVPLQQSERMVEAVKSAGGFIELIVKPGGGHPWLTIREEVVTMADWLDKHLRD